MADVCGDTCGWRWYGPREDVSEAYAWHVCMKVSGHRVWHRCTCGACHG